MQAEEIKELLVQSAADDWEIRDTKTTGWEFYFIKHDLDQNRIRNTEHIKVRVYKKTDTYLGQAEAEIAPTATREQAVKLINDLLNEASYVKNPAYELIKGDGNEKKAEEPVSLKQNAKEYIQLLNSIPEDERAYVNSCEIFTNAVNTHLITSRGIDEYQAYPTSAMEIVLNAKDSKREIELYRMYNAGTCDSTGLKQSIVKTMQYGIDRLQAEKTPKMGKTAVVFSTQDTVTLFRYFQAMLNAQSLYQHISDWQLGKPICEAKGDRVTLTAVKHLPNSSRNMAFDEDGSEIYDKVLLKDDVPQAYWGNRMYSQYMNLENTFAISNFEISGGTGTEADIRKGRYLEVVEFSDFQCDTLTGDIFGEIRLAYLHDGDSCRIVTGGSVSGSMKDFIKEMYMTKEQVQYDNAKVPALVRLENATIAGVENEVTK